MEGNLSLNLIGKHSKAEKKISWTPKNGILFKRYKRPEEGYSSPLNGAET